MHISILGRQPALGLAELEALYDSTALTPLGNQAVLIDGPVDFARLGGSIKIAHHLATIPQTDLPGLIGQSREHALDLITAMPEGKVKLGLSFYGYSFSPQKINAAGLELKKTIRAHGRSVRVIPNAEPALSSAQSLHNQLTSPLGLELVLVRHQDRSYIGRVIETQNINDYTLRDRGRPKRDALVGMLPPKLAQIMINLAIGKGLPAADSALSLSEDSGSVPERDKTCILDPFCGTGVVLQEAALMGYSVYGSDLSQRMIDYTETNLQWLRRTYDLSFDSRLETGDATTHHWQHPISSVVSETYLGQPLTSLPASDKLARIAETCDQLLRDFLANLAPQLSAGARLCLAVPTWKTPTGFLHLTTLDDLENLGYNRIDFEYASTTELIYHREDQLVARELVVITRK